MSGREPADGRRFVFDVPLDDAEPAGERELALRQAQRTVAVEDQPQVGPVGHTEVLRFPGDVGACAVRGARQRDVARR